MARGAAAPSVADMTYSAPPPTPPTRQRASLDWLLVISLAVMPLLHAVFSIAGWAEALGRPQTPLLLTLVITVVWVLVVGLSRAEHPILTLVLAGALSGVVSATLSLIVPVLRSGDATNLSDGGDVMATLLVTIVLFAAWGALAGCLAAGVQRLRGRRAH